MHSDGGRSRAARDWPACSRAARGGRHAAERPTAGRYGAPCRIPRDADGRRGQRPRTRAPPPRRLDGSTPPRPLGAPVDTRRRRRGRQPVGHVGSGHQDRDLPAGRRALRFQWLHQRRRHPDGAAAAAPTCINFEQNDGTPHSAEVARGPGRCPTPAATRRFRAPTPTRWSRACRRGRRTSSGSPRRTAGRYRIICGVPGPRAVRHVDLAQGGSGGQGAELRSRRSAK